MTRSAFTLIELTVVLALLALLLAVATFSLRGPYRAAKFTAAVEQVGLFERQVRGQARRLDLPVDVSIDLGTGRLTATGDQASKFPTQVLQLPGGTRIDCLLMADGRVTHGRATIRLTAHGQSPSYALRLRGSSTSSRWVLFAGLTGQTTLMNDEKPIRDLLLATVE